MHIIHQIASTLRALSDGDVHFCKNSKFVDILGEMCKIVKIWKCQKSIVINIETSARTCAYYTSNYIYSSSSFPSTLRALFDGDVHFCENSKFIDILGVKCAEIVKIWKFQK
jgi:hypothetical protein